MSGVCCYTQCCSCWTRYVCLIPDHRDGGGSVWTRYVCLIPDHSDGGNVWTRYVCLIPDHRDGAVCGLGMSI